MVQKGNEDLLLSFTHLRLKVRKQFGDCNVLNQALSSTRYHLSSLIQLIVSAPWDCLFLRWMLADEVYPRLFPLTSASPLLLPLGRQILATPMCCYLREDSD
jgi:hypothetical protein